MRKILLFEPWHLGDVAVTLSVIKDFTHSDFEFGLVCDHKWMEWVLSTNLAKKVIPFTPPWTVRHRKDKYNPSKYKLKNFLKLRKEVIKYNPDVIIDLRGDLRASIFLKLLVGNKTKVITSRLSGDESVYRRGEIVQRELNVDKVTRERLKSQNDPNKVTLFFGAADFNRTLPTEKAFSLVMKLHQEGFVINIIFQPNEPLTKFTELKQSRGLSNLTLYQDSLINIADLIRTSRYVISTDSGWLHVAFFYGVTTIGLFGYNTIKAWAPPGSHIITPKSLYPAKYRYQGDHKHLQPLGDLDVGDVLKLMMDLRSFA